MDITRIDRPASEPVAQEELITHATGEATCEMGMATTTAGNNEQRARLIQEGDIASKYETSPVSSTWKSEVTTDDITQDGTNATPTLNLGNGPLICFCQNRAQTQSQPRGGRAIEAVQCRGS